MIAVKKNQIKMVEIRWVSNMNHVRKSSTTVVKDGIFGGNR